MDSEVFDEDSINAEALQAQIDLSMSFAQDLVSSWLEPHTFPTSCRNGDLEKELTDYIKRPSRLGVGASIPEGQKNLSRDAARLKGKLSKRPRENEDSGAAVSAKHVSYDDDDQESRARAIKKQPRTDPFDVMHKKKKKRQEADKPKSSSGVPASLPQECNKSTDTIRQTPRLLNGVSELEKSLSTSKTAEDKPTNLQPTETFSEPPFRAPLTPSRVHSSKQDGIAIGSLASPQSYKHKNVFDSPMSPSSGALLLRNPLLLKHPILNLTGPPPSDDETDPDAGPAPPNSSQKKKKKRKKKKKKLTQTDPPTQGKSNAPLAGS